MMFLFNSIPFLMPPVRRVHTCCSPRDFQSLDALPLAEREAVNNIWSTFSSASNPSRELILRGILTMCCFSQLSFLAQELNNIIRLDPFVVLPLEVAMKVLNYLDAISLARASQVSRRWHALAEDDVLWRNICEQHIDKKCRKCGWGLPLLDNRPRILWPSSSTPGGSRDPDLRSTSPKREREPEVDAANDPQPTKRFKSDPHSGTSTPAISSRDSTPQPLTPQPLFAPSCLPQVVTRPWKNVYCERLRVEKNWRKGRYVVRTLHGHEDGVMCLQFAENLAYLPYPVLISGSYDHTVRVWNMDTGAQVRCMRGHTRAIRALQFDEIKLITGSMDRTLRVWNWRTGECIRTLEGHSEGVVALAYDAHILVSGSVDTTVRVWNFLNGDSFTLRGHRDWVNAVLLWDDKSKLDDPNAASVDDGRNPIIPAGKMLFSASDDGTVRLWDLAQRVCVRVFSGHVGQVQSLKLLMVDRSRVEEVDEEEPESHSPSFPSPQGFDPTAHRSNPNTPPAVGLSSGSASSSRKEQSVLAFHSSSHPTPVLLSGSLDNTIKVWDVETGKPLKTLFGHIEGVWAVDGDRLRVISGSHDRTIKIWERETGRCQTTLVGHRGAVTCLSLADDKIVSGGDDGDLRIWDFGLKAGY
jgi:F-box and WD-40 domain protein MET30